MKYLLMLAVLLASTQVLGHPPDPLTEYRYYGSPKRNPTTGVILRRNDILVAFRKVHVCPSTLSYVGTCPGWSMDHIIPLACGGYDAVWNLQWLPNGLKVLAPLGKDRWERNINAYVIPFPDTATCVNKVINF
jgi:hypothetical protein